MMQTLKFPNISIENVKPLFKEFNVFDTDPAMQSDEGSIFTLINNQLPSKIEFSVNRDTAVLIREKLFSEFTIPKGNITIMHNFDYEDQNNFFIVINRNLYIQIEEEFFANIKVVYPYGQYPDFIKSISGLIKKLEDKKRKRTDNFHLILFHQDGDQVELKVKQFKLKPFKINIKDNYNDDFIPVHNRIIERLNNLNDKGIVLLHGEPGTGKTTYIRYLSRTLDKKVIYIPPQFSADLTSTAFMELMMKHTNSVLIIEDAENIIEARDLGRNLSIAGLLNIADGLLSFCLKLQIICTFNTNLSRIDPALLRKGRLIALYEFKALETRKAKHLAENLGVDVPVTRPMTLAEIYGHKEKEFRYIPKQIAGFST